MQNATIILPPEATEIRSLRPTYRTRDGSLAKEFFDPCLRHCTHYRRAAGYFSSSVLNNWSGALLRMIRSDVFVQLLISPELSAEDAKVLKETASSEKRFAYLSEVTDRIVEEAVAFMSNPNNSELRLRIFAWMIASGKLEIRFAVPRHIEDAGIFHEKSGVFIFPWGDRVAFEGSANETISGHARNYEKVQVFRSWEDADGPRVTAIEEDFDYQWNSEDDDLIVVPLSENAIKLIKTRAPEQRPTLKAPTQASFRWRHQNEAKCAFIAARHGIIEMATGTGKTRTALMILDDLFHNGEIQGAVITTTGNDLLDQWYRTLIEHPTISSRKLRVIRQYGTSHQGQTFALNPLGAIAVISRDQLASVLRLIGPDQVNRLLIVHDEVHGLGAPQCLKTLEGKHRGFGYVLGLSATPEREYDDDGSAFISNEIGPVVYRFDLKDAIRRGILAEFDYVRLRYRLTDDDRKRLSAVYSRKATREKEGKPMSPEELWTELARVYKTAELKPSIFAEYLKDHSGAVKNAIVFVEEKTYGELILPIINLYTHLYRTYYAEDDRQHLVDFAKGAIDCLVTCHRISQGIDIQKLRTVVLFSASRARLETIQRIGRCLRTDPNEPNKRALVVDFVREVDEDDKNLNADLERAEWLADLAETMREE